MTDKQFNSLTKAEQRVQIAKDIIRQVKIKKYNPETGNYINYFNFKDDNFNKGNQDIKKNFNQIKQCTVCALGSCIMSITKYKNKLTFEESYNIPNISNTSGRLLASLFTPKQLLLIEETFEGFHESITFIGAKFGAKLTQLEVDYCSTFYEEYERDDSRLIAICKNIIKHKGTFVPKNL